MDTKNTLNLYDPAEYPTAVVIPSLNPDEKLRGVVDGLIACGFDDIIVVDDGSAPKHKSNFPEPSDRVTLLTHPVNRGKGAAMKTAFRHILERDRNCAGVVTVDGDGQHRPEDVIACVNAMADGIKASESGADKTARPALVMGCRNFDLPHVPERSRKGNKITSTVFRILFGMKIRDTQTGLRAIPAKYLEKMTKISGDRYEYEMNMLMALKPAGIPVREVEIETVYINENETSHFRPVRDSLRIYGLIIKFLLSSVIAAVVDFGAFYGFQKLLRFFLVPYDDYIAAGLARLISSLVNFTVNKEAVFKGKGSVGKLILRYYALAIPILCISAASVHFIGGVFGGTPFVKTLVKIPVDLILFAVSFRIQREWVFRDDDKKK